MNGTLMTSDDKNELTETFGVPTALYTLNADRFKRNRIVLRRLLRPRNTNHGRLMELRIEDFRPPCSGTLSIYIISTRLHSIKFTDNDSKTKAYFDIGVDSMNPLPCITRSIPVPFLGRPYEDLESTYLLVLSFRPTGHPLVDVRQSISALVRRGRDRGCERERERQSDPPRAPAFTSMSSSTPAELATSTPHSNQLGGIKEQKQEQNASFTCILELLPRAMYSPATVGWFTAGNGQAPGCFRSLCSPIGSLCTEVSLDSEKRIEDRLELVSGKEVGHGNQANGHEPSLGSGVPELRCRVAVRFPILWKASLKVSANRKPSQSVYRPLGATGLGNGLTLESSLDQLGNGMGIGASSASGSTADDGALHATDGDVVPVDPSARSVFFHYVCRRNQPARASVGSNSTKKTPSVAAVQYVQVYVERRGCIACPWCDGRNNTRQGGCFPPLMCYTVSPPHVERKRKRADSSSCSASSDTWTHRSYRFVSSLLCHLRTFHQLFDFEAAIDDIGHLHIVVERSQGGISKEDNLQTQITKPFLLLNRGRVRGMDRKQLFAQPISYVSTASSDSSSVTQGWRANLDLNKKHDSASTVRPQSYYAHVGKHISEHELQILGPIPPIDSDWMTRFKNDVIDEYEDIANEEKEFYKMWNKYCDENPPHGNNYLSHICDGFITTHIDVVIAKKLRYNYLLHMMNLWDFGLVSVDDINRVMAFIDSKDLKSKS